MRSVIARISIRVHKLQIAKLEYEDDSERREEVEVQCDINQLVELVHEEGHGVEETGPALLYFSPKGLRVNVVFSALGAVILRIIREKLLEIEI